jgi:hypothetical protein
MAPDGKAAVLTAEHRNGFSLCKEFGLANRLSEFVDFIAAGKWASVLEEKTWSSRKGRMANQEAMPEAWKRMNTEANSAPRRNDGTP